MGMTIKKYAHACLLIEMKGVRIIADPGNWNELPDATGVHALLITHEHQDHMDLGQIKQIMERNPGLRIITHAGVAPKLAEAGLSCETIEPGQTIDVNGLPIESFGTEHAVVYGSSPCRNCFRTPSALSEVP